MDTGGFDTLDIVLRLVAATAIGMALGLERALRGKPTGMRTLGLVSFGSALVSLGMGYAPGIHETVDAFGRVLQGAEQGVLVGIGFLGGGIILRDLTDKRIFNLTTAAEVWVIAAMGLVAGVAPWIITGAGVAIMVVLIVLCRMIETRFNLKDHP